MKHHKPQLDAGSSCFFAFITAMISLFAMFVTRLIDPLGRVPLLAVGIGIILLFMRGIGEALSRHASTKAMRPLVGMIAGLSSIPVLVFAATLAVTAPVVLCIGPYRTVESAATPRFQFGLIMAMVAGTWLATVLLRGNSGRFVRSSRVLLVTSVLIAGAGIVTSLAVRDRIDPRDYVSNLPEVARLTPESPFKIVAVGQQQLQLLMRPPFVDGNPCGVIITRINQPITNPGPHPIVRCSTTIVRADTRHRLLIVEKNSSDAPWYITGYHADTLQRTNIYPTMLRGSLQMPSGWLVLSMLGYALGIANLFRPGVRPNWTRAVHEGGGFFRLDNGQLIAAKEWKTLPSTTVAITGDISQQTRDRVYRADLAESAIHSIELESVAMDRVNHGNAAKYLFSVCCILMTFAPLATALVLVY